MAKDEDVKKTPPPPVVKEDPKKTDDPKIGFGKEADPRSVAPSLPPDAPINPTVREALRQRTQPVSDKEAFAGRSPDELDPSPQQLGPLAHDNAGVMAHAASETQNQVWDTEDFPTPGIRADGTLTDGRVKGRREEVQVLK